MNKKKILLTSLSGQLGGLELRLCDELRFLSHMGYDTELALNSFPDIYPWVDNLLKEGIRFNFFNPPPFFEQWRWRYINKLRAEWFYKQFFLKRMPDLIHVAMAWTDTGGTRLWLANRCNIPTVISVHNAFYDHAFTPWCEKLLQESFQSVRGIYAVSDSALDSFVKIFHKFIRNNTILEVIYNPVNTDKFIPSDTFRLETRNKLNCKENEIVIGVVGRLDGQKQPELMIDVFSILKKKFSHLQLVFIGQGHLEVVCRQKVNVLGLNSCVHFLGFQPHVEQILPALDIHVLLSTLEGFGIATAEAMACGVPVIATDVPGSRDILKNSNAGFLVSKDDINQIVNVLSELILDAEKRKNMSLMGPLEVKKRFSADLIEAKLEKFYRDVLF